MEEPNREPYGACRSCRVDFDSTEEEMQASERLLDPS